MKSVIITGANRGIGLDTSLAFGRAGYKVFATMRHPETANDLKQKIEKESLPISILKMDVNSDESVMQAMNTIKEDHGFVDVLVNNAGIERHGTIEDLDLSEFKDVMETNYFGVIRCIKSVFPDMRGSHRVKLAQTSQPAPSSPGMRLQILTRRGSDLRSA